MALVTLEQINSNVLEIKKELHELKLSLKEDFPLAKDLREQIESSLARPDAEFVPHGDVKKRYS